MTVITTVATTVATPTPRTAFPTKPDIAPGNVATSQGGRRYHS